jgi:hypothetical protein
MQCDAVLSSGFLAGKYQGVKLNSIGDPVYYVGSPDGVSTPCQSELVEAINQLNQDHAKVVDDPDIADRIAQYELAFRMQMATPELTDFSSEDPAIIAEYGCTPGDGSFASNCLMARRLAERGVRFTQIYLNNWDHHRNVGGRMPSQCKDIDQPCHALIQDLKQRGMFDDTLIIWGGEFGRTIYSQGTLTETNYGRDHHPRCFTVFLAGGGIKPGMTLGETDDFCYNIAENPVHIRDLHATLLHCLGIDHGRFSYKFRGLHTRLTGVEDAHVVKGILT